MTRIRANLELLTRARECDGLDALAMQLYSGAATPRNGAHG